MKLNVLVVRLHVLFAIIAAFAGAAFMVANRPVFLPLMSNTMVAAAALVAYGAVALYVLSIEIVDPIVIKIAKKIKKSHAR